MSAAGLVQVALLALGAVGAIVTAWWFDAACARRGFLPPGFANPLRRVAASALLAVLLWVAVFVPLATAGSANEIDPRHLSIPQLFFLQGLLAMTAIGWFLLGFAAVAPRPPSAASALPVGSAAVDAPPEDFSPEGFKPEASAEPALEHLPVEPPPLPAVDPRPAIAEAPPSLGSLFAAQFGFRAPSIAREVGFGLAAGLAIWFAVLMTLALVAMGLMAAGGGKLVPQRAPAVIPWIAGLPIVVRIALSLSAGFVEETFFRGFLQPRVGIAFSTVCFVLAHASYGQPFMLVGVTLLSLVYARLVAWRQNLWPAIAAHALFDAVQLLVVIPTALRFVPS